MESVLLVNAPWAMHAILRILTPLLPQRVVRVSGCNVATLEDRVRIQVPRPPGAL